MYMRTVYTDLNHHSSVSTCVAPSHQNHRLLSSRPTCAQFTLTHTTIICQVPVYSYHWPKPSFFCQVPVYSYHWPKTLCFCWVPVYSYHWPKTSFFCQVPVYTSYWPTLSFFCQTGPLVQFPLTQAITCQVPVYSSHWPKPSSCVKYLFTPPADQTIILLSNTCAVPLT